jgi:lactoylglutathione lyase
MKMVEFSSVGHVAIKTSDIERSLDFYVRQLGFSEMLRLHYSDDSLFLIYLRVTDTQYLELFPYGIGDRAPDRDAVALNHFCPHRRQYRSHAAPDCAGGHCIDAGTEDWG